MAKKKQDSPKASNPDLNRSLLRSMLLQRRFEERCAEAYALGKIGGFCHLYIGQEAVGAGAISVLRPDDYVITSSTSSRVSPMPRMMPVFVGICGARRFAVRKICITRSYRPPGRHRL